MSYVSADVVEAAFVRLPVTRDALGADGIIADQQIRVQIAGALAALAKHCSH